MTRDRSVEGVPAARLWAATRFPYLATGLFGAQVSADPGSGTVSVDESWRMHADPELTAGWSAAQLGSVLVHHVCHLLRIHGERAQGAGVRPDETQRWIRAADAEINDDLIPAGLDLPGQPVLPCDLGADDGLLAEQYFAGIRRATKAGGGTGAGTGTRSASAGPEEAEGTWLDCGSGADGAPRPGQGLRDQGGLPRWQAELLRRQVAQDVITHGKQPGTVPAGLLRWAEEVLHPKVDWRTVLAAELRRAVAEVCGAVDYSYRRPSRRSSVTAPVVLPALRRPVPEVAVVCDTSGSMTADLLAMVLAEVEGLLRALGLARQVRVLACDTAVAPAQRVSSARQVQLVGGGGTDMGAGIAAAAALRPRPAVTVVLTDGFTPWPHVPPKGMRVVVGLLGEQAPEAPSWARSVRVEPLGVKSRPRDQILTLIAIALTFGSGATDVSAFTRLGGVFTSVMTGNIVFWGLSAGERSVSLATHTTVAIAGYIAGVAVATWVSHGVKVRGARSPAGAGQASALAGHVSWALFSEFVLLAGAATGWVITAGRPRGGVEFALLAVTAAAMGIQSAAVNELGFSNLSTTFLTGTLTWLVTSLARPGGDTSGGMRRLSVLIGLGVGAALSGLLVANAPRAVPALALTAMVTALVLARLPVCDDE